MAEVYQAEHVGDVPRREFVREVPVPVYRTSPVSLVLMFVLGLICAGVIAFGAATIMGVRTTSHPFSLSWPAGHVDFGGITPPHVVRDTAR